MNVNICQHCELRNWAFAVVCEGCGHSLNINHTIDGVEISIYEELHKPGPRSLSKHPRIVSALWFAIAAMIPGLLIVLYEMESNASIGPLLAITLIPASLGAIYGTWLGAAIVDPRRSMSFLGAFSRGSLIALLSFVTIGFMYDFLIFYFNPGLKREAMNVIGTLGLILLYGFILVGWWATLLGGLAGCLLRMTTRSRSFQG